ncbi:uncharacterized protein AMSG_10409 [Thecamonas trahens ATCC 50062]|uniref:PH domain-containing protein n=1 Tax=Thecamonas trahens ATCC 50062 TaxID=461836 RepID=A0A0L0DQJ8_THETB|nr:hypothetical protein AMSG_10409 [Thecamonas trahens ATCC 50062]KNC54559.1 hypothetical protein AMSG_10409 [Thecamonas trahens ATCC 50062]|eukprot:XP_013753574.1 hypothetical protein AMSG_10409 [Thecamonas trahens ATCC 50062]
MTTASERNKRRRCTISSVWRFKTSCYRSAKFRGHRVSLALVGMAVVLAFLCQAPMAEASCVSPLLAPAPAWPLAGDASFGPSPLAVMPDIPACLPEREAIAVVATTSADGVTGVRLVDINNDGALDVISYEELDDSISLFLNQGMGAGLAPRAVIGPPSPPIEYDRPRSVAFGDIDGDSLVDMASASQVDDAVGWTRNLGSGLFGSRNVVSPAADGASGVALADLDGDGDLDLAACSANDDSVRWWRNVDGKGNFVFVQLVSAATDGAADIAAVDVNADGDVDLVVVSSNDNKLAWFANNGSYFGTERIISATLAKPVALAVGDMNGDGVLDLVVAFESANTVAWFANSHPAPGSFSSPLPITTSALSVRGVAVGDLDTDGDLDVALASDGDQTVAWFANADGRGTFATSPRVVTTAYAGPRDVAIGDIDGDGKADLAAVFRTADTVAWFPHAVVPGSFAAGPTSIATALDGVGAVVLGDLDADGDLDLVTASPGELGVAWRANIDGDAVAWSSPRSVAPSPPGTHALALADLDADGDLDLVLGSSEPGAAALGYALNVDGVGGFAPVVALAWSANATGGLALADYDLDGDVDIAVFDSSGTTLVVLLNRGGDDGFGPELAVDTTGSDIAALVAADLNNDALPDLVAAHAGAGAVLWYAASNGAGLAFVAAAVVANTDVAGASALAIGDVDGNGALDVIVGATTDTTIAWYANAGNGAFALGATVDAGASDVAVLATADLDADGELDIVAGRGGVVNTMAMYANTGNGTSFAAASVLVAGVTQPTAVLVADIDGDGDRDLVYTSAGADLVAWLPQTSRTAFADYLPQQHGLARDDPACAVTSSFACVTASLGRLSRCVRDTLVLPTGSYGCRRDAHALVTRPIAVASADCAAPAVFNCTARGGGVLFRALAHPSAGVPTVGDLELQGVSLVRLGTAQVSPFGAPGLRAEGAGARLALVNASVSDATSTVRPGVFFFDEGIGGAVLVDDGATFVSHRTLWARCTSSRFGGAVALRRAGTTAVVSDSVFTSCASDGSGGALAVLAGVAVSANNTRFVGNSAGVGGGAVALLEIEATLVGRGLEFDGNVAAGGLEAGGGGGAVAVVGSRTVLVLESGSRVVNNTASRGCGGGVLVRSSASQARVSLLATALVGNAAGVAGGAVATRAAPQSGASVVLGTGSSVARSRATFGGALAAVSSAYPWPSSSSLASVARGLATSAVPSIASIALVDGVEVGEAEAPFGSLVFVCDAVIELSGSVLAPRSPSSGGSALACAASGVNAPAPPSGWLVESGIGASLLRVTPPTALVPDPGTFPPATVSGSLLGAGSMGVFDSYGQRVRDQTLVLFATSATAGVEANGLETGTAVSSVTGSGGLGVLRLSALAETIGDARGGLPSAIQVRLSGAVGSEPPTAAVTVNVTLCPIGFGAVSSPGAVLECGACSDGSASATVSAEPCVAVPPCPANTLRLATTNATVVAPCLCKERFWSPSKQADVECIACPRGGLCDGGLAAPRAAPGFFPDATDPALFVSCPRAEACLGDGLCASGYRARLCAECESDYFKLSGSCRRCQPERNVAIVLLLLAGVLMVTTVLLGFNLAESLRYKFAAAMIGLNALQISAIYGSLDFDWGELATLYFDIASAVNLNVELTSPECASASGTDVWVLKWVLTLLLPLFAAIVLVPVCGVFAGLIVGNVWWLGKKNLDQLRGAAGRTLFQMIVLLYLPLTSASLAPFGCRKEETGRWVLDADPVRSCYNEAWWGGLFVPGVLATAVYAVGLPAGVAILLSRRRAALDPISFVLRFGFLVGRFADEAWWFEVAIMLRKLGVVVCMTAFFSSEGKASAAVLVLVGSLGQLVYLRPYRSTLHNRLAVVVLAAASLILYTGMLDARTLRMIGVTIGVVTIVAAIVVGNGLDLYLMARREKEIEEDEYFSSGTFHMHDGGEVELGGLGMVHSISGTELHNMQASSVDIGSTLSTAPLVESAAPAAAGMFDSPPTEPEPPPALLSFRLPPPMPHSVTSLAQQFDSVDANRSNIATGGSVSSTPTATVAMATHGALGTIDLESCESETAPLYSVTAGVTHAELSDAGELCRPLDTGPTALASATSSGDSSSSGADTQASTTCAATTCGSVTAPFARNDGSNGDLCNGGNMRSDGNGGARGGNAGGGDSWESTNSDDSGAGTAVEVDDSDDDGRRGSVVDVETIGGSNHGGGSAPARRFTETGTLVLDDVDTSSRRKRARRKGRAKTYDAGVPSPKAETATASSGLGFGLGTSDANRSGWTESGTLVAARSTLGEPPRVRDEQAAIDALMALDKVQLAARVVAAEARLSEVLILVDNMRAEMLARQGIDAEDARAHTAGAPLARAKTDVALMGSDETGSPERSGSSAPVTPRSPTSPQAATDGLLPASAAAADSTYASWLQKRDPITGLWSRFYVVFHGEERTLSYYAHEKAPVRLGRFVFQELPLKVVYGADVLGELDEDIPYCFGLSCNSRLLHVFSAVTGVDLLNWCAALGQVCAGVEANAVALPGTEADTEAALNALVASVFFLRRRAQYLSTVARKGKLMWGQQLAVLYNFRLYFFESDEDIKPIESVCIVGYSVRPLTSERARPNSFRISHPGLPSYTLAVDSRRKLATWVGALTSAANLQRQWFIEGNEEFDRRAAPATSQVHVSIKLDKEVIRKPSRPRAATDAQAVAAAAAADGPLPDDGQDGGGAGTSSDVADGLANVRSRLTRGSSISERRKRLIRRRSAVSRALSIAELKDRMSSKLLAAYKFRSSLSIDDVVNMLREFHGLPLLRDERKTGFETPSDDEYEYATASDDDSSGDSDNGTMVLTSTPRSPAWSPLSSPAAASTGSGGKSSDGDA